MSSKPTYSCSRRNWPTSSGEGPEASRLFLGYRELLTDHRVPGLLLEAMKVAVKKQRKKIKAKMLGTPEEAEGSDDEDDSWLLLSNDKEDAPLVPGSRIQNFFSLWYRGETEAPEAETSSTAPSNLQEGEAAPQHPHLEPVGSLPAPDS